MTTLDINDLTFAEDLAMSIMKVEVENVSIEFIGIKEDTHKGMTVRIHHDSDRAERTIEFPISRFGARLMYDALKPMVDAVAPKS